MILVNLLFKLLDHSEPCSLYQWKHITVLLLFQLEFLKCKSFTDSCRSCVFGLRGLSLISNTVNLKAHFQASGNFWQLKALKKWWKKALFVLKIFKFVEGYRNVLKLSFEEKYFLLYSINWPNFIFWLPLLGEILGNMCIVIVC